MDAHLTRAAFLALALAGLVALPAIAQSVVDPTRPAGGAPVPSGQSLAAPAGPHLQSVLVSPQRRVAIINGETVTVGDMVGEARVVRILESEVVLRAGDEVRIVKMYPDIAKTLPAPAGVGRAIKQKQ